MKPYLAVSWALTMQPYAAVSRARAHETLPSCIAYSVAHLHT